MNSARQLTQSIRAMETAPEPFHAFHWPDHVIGKRESRRIREDHNALYNSHAALTAELENARKNVGDWCAANHRQIGVIQAQRATIAELLACLKTILDAVDYTKGNCRTNDMVSAALDRVLITNARKAIAKAEGKAAT